MKRFFSTLINKLPEFSPKNYGIASKVCAGLLAAAAIFFIYEMFTVDEFGISVNWNIFKSAWLGPLYVVGVVLAIVFWGKFGHWGGQPMIEYEDPNGNKDLVRNDDIVENVYWKILIPLLGHFVIEPIVYACLIYYPLMCVFALLGLILPYALSLILLGIAVGAYMSDKFTEDLRFRSTILIVITTLLTVALVWISINMESGKAKVVEEVTEDVLDCSEEDVLVCGEEEIGDIVE